MTNWECRMTNDGPEWQFRAGLQPSGDGGGEFHDGFPTLLSIAFLSAVPRFILAAVFAGQIKAARFSQV